MITARSVHSSRTEPKNHRGSLTTITERNKEKRKYVPYSEQKNPSWHLKRYHTRKTASEKTLETAADLSNISCDADADDGHAYVDIWPDDSGCTDHPTSKSEEGDFMYISEEPLNLCPTESEASISESEEEEFRSSSQDKEMDCSSIPDEPAQTAYNLSSEQNDEPLYEGSSVSKILAYVLIVSFVLKHNLSKVAWQYLLRVIAVLLGNHCGEVMKSVYKMKLFLKNYFGTVEPRDSLAYISSSKELFNKAKPHYESALKQSGHDKKLIYTERKKPATHTAWNSHKNRQRNIIWFNPPYSLNIQTNIGREFLNLVGKHFPKNHWYNKIFNKNNKNKL